MLTLVFRIRHHFPALFIIGKAWQNVFFKREVTAITSTSTQTSNDPSEADVFTHRYVQLKDIRLHLVEGETRIVGGDGQWSGEAVESEEI